MTTRDPLAEALREALAAEPADRADDDALIARAIARAGATLAAPRPAAPPAGAAPASTAPRATESAAPRAIRSARPSTGANRARVLRFALPIAAAFAASMALAAAYVSTRPSASAPEAPVEAPKAEAPAPAPTQIMPAEVAAEPTISVHDLPSAHPLAAATSQPVASSPPPLAGGGVTAAELFREANTERRSGNVDKAVELYGALQKSYPDAAETQASRVSLGRLLLDRRGDAGGALAQFDSYLATAASDGGTLAEEARVGRALALERLGRSEEERNAWRELLARHPKSLYGARARERLESLGRAP